MTNPSPWPMSPAAAMLVVGRFDVSDGHRDEFEAAARRAVAVLAEQSGCTSASLGQSTDDPNRFVIRTEWTGVGAYRRALSSFDVKMHAIPLLSSAIDEPSAYEIVDHWTPEGHSVASSGLAADAGAVGLGRAAAPEVPSVTT